MKTNIFFTAKLLFHFCGKQKKNTMKILMKKVTTNFFWKTVKPFLLDKIGRKVIENVKIISEDSDVAQALNSFFSSIVTNLKISEYTDNNSNSENIADQIKIILK